MAPDAKAMARDQVAQALAAGGFGQREVLIRINALDSPWWIDDVTMAGKARPDGILVPKVSSVADLTAIADRLTDINADISIRVWAMIETARGGAAMPRNWRRQAQDSEMRLAGFVFGPNDISRETRIRMLPGRAAMMPMITPLHAGRARHGLSKFSTAPTATSPISTALRQECAQARDLGFDGKTLIHPGQIDACNAIFTPPAEEVAQARKIIAAFAQAGERLARRDPARRPDGGAAARRHGEEARSRSPMRSRRRGADKMACELPVIATQSEVIAGLDPAIHHSIKQIQRDCAGQARA